MIPIDFSRLKSCGKKLFVFFLLSSTVLSIARAQPCQRYHVNQRNVSTGVCAEKYALDENGEKHGVYRSFFEDGHVHITAVYKHGVLDGKYQDSNDGYKIYNNGKVISGAYAGMKWENGELIEVQGLPIENDMVTGNISFSNDLLSGSSLFFQDHINKMSYDFVNTALPKVMETYCETKFYKGLEMEVQNGNIILPEHTLNFTHCSVQFRPGPLNSLDPEKFLLKIKNKHETIDFAQSEPSVKLTEAGYNKELGRLFEEDTKKPPAEQIDFTKYYAFLDKGIAKYSGGKYEMAFKRVKSYFKSIDKKYNSGLPGKVEIWDELRILKYEANVGNMQFSPTERYLNWYKFHLFDKIEAEIKDIYLSEYERGKREFADGNIAEAKGIFDAFYFYNQALTISRHVHNRLGYYEAEKTFAWQHLAILEYISGNYSKVMEIWKTIDEHCPSQQDVWETYSFHPVLRAVLIFVGKQYGNDRYRYAAQRMAECRDGCEWDHMDNSYGELSIFNLVKDHSEITEMKQYKKVMQYLL